MQLNTSHTESSKWHFMFLRFEVYDDHLTSYPHCAHFLHDGRIQVDLEWTNMFLK